MAPRNCRFRHEFGGAWFPFDRPLLVFWERAVRLVRDHEQEQVLRWAAIELWAVARASPRAWRRRDNAVVLAAGAPYRAVHIAVGADKGFDTQACIDELRAVGSTPYVAQDITVRHPSAIDARSQGQSHRLSDFFELHVWHAFFKFPGSLFPRATVARIARLNVIGLCAIRVARLLGGFLPAVDAVNDPRLKAGA